MNQPPRSSRTTLLSRSFLILIGWQSAMLAAVALIAYVWALGKYGPGPRSHTIALFTLVSVQLGHTFNCRSRTRSAFDGLFRNPFIWIAVLVVVTLQLFAAYFVPLAAVLGTVPPSTVDWLIIGACGLLVIAIVEVVKSLNRRSM
jgi:Ca2+-transporting ATPase